MTVRQKLLEYNASQTVVIKQYPIHRIDSSCSLVVRATNTAINLSRSEQNYLDYEVIDVTRNENSIDVIVCKANPKQEYEVISAMYSGRM